MRNVLFMEHPASLYTSIGTPLLEGEGRETRATSRANNIQKRYCYEHCKYRPHFYEEFVSKPAF